MRLPAGRDAADDAARLLFTQWGSVVHVDDAGSLRHGPYVEGKQTVWLEDDLLHLPGQAPRPVSLAAAPYGSAKFVHADGLFYAAEPDGAISHSRMEPSAAARFLLLPRQQVRDVSEIAQSDWSLPDGGIISARHISFGDDFVLKFGQFNIHLDTGPNVIAFARNGPYLNSLLFLHDRFKTGRARRFRPLLYFCVFGPDHLYDMLKLCLHSIGLHGQYEGEIFILTDRNPRDVVQYIPPSVPNKVTLFGRPAAGPVEMMIIRYDFSELPIREFQPVLCLDADMICDAPLRPLLTTANREERFFVTSEYEGMPVSVLPDHLKTWFGDFLFNASGLDLAKMTCLNGGAIGFPNVDYALPIFKMVEICMREYKRDVPNLDRFVEQPFMGYVLQSQNLVDTTSLNPYVRFRMQNFKPEHPRTGLVHFNQGVAGNKMADMTAYLHSIAPLPPAPPTGIREVSPGVRLNRSIPGQMSDAELLRLIELAAAVPEGGVIVEVGCLYGLSSWHIAQHCKPGVTLFCIDPWQREPWIIELVEKRQNAPQFSRAAFEKFTADCNNIVMLQGYSPEVARGWHLPIDLYVEDAVHTNPILAQNMAFWSSFVRPGGTICGHDYTAEWSDVMAEADGVAARLGSEVVVVETFWSVARP